MVKLKTLARVAWAKLSSIQKSQRNKAFEILRMMKKGDSFTSALKEVDISSLLAKKHLGRAIFKKAGRFKATKSDSIQRRIEFYSKTKGRIFITVRNSRDASLIGEYFSAVRKAKPTGETSELDRFKGKIVIDADGEAHKFETDIDKIFEIEESIEEPEFRDDIYEEVSL
ncbi:MAG: hypothetical protein AABX23_04800 [Nanoarchaeota archaeon]